jgi:NADPH-dependent glutamate synthase beta chain and related oxidoreductases
LLARDPLVILQRKHYKNLANEERVFEIDMIERLPTPWGLVRSGVAPDHPKIKTVSKVFEKIATAENF